MLVKGSDYPAATLGSLGWKQDLTPVQSLDDDRWFKTYDGCWLIKDIWIPEEEVINFSELRVAIDDEATSLVYINGSNVPLGVLDCRDSFSFSEGTLAVDLFAGTITRYLQNPPLRHGRNRIAIQVINTDGNGHTIPSDDYTYEYFNMELVLNGTRYLIRRGDDRLKESTKSATWWTYYNRGSQSPPPVDAQGLRWFETDYSLDNMGDYDMDGLKNEFESKTRSNPRASDSDGNGILDPQEDYDQDGLVNIDEQSMGTDPTLWDTDDDGVSDGLEKENGSDPANSLSPRRGRYLRFGGEAGDYVEMPTDPRFALSSFTVEARVNPRVTWAVDGTILRRAMGGNPDATENFVLGLNANREPYVRFMSFTGLVEVVGPQALPAGTINGTSIWTWVQASYDAGKRELYLYVNGIAAGHLRAVADRLRGRAGGALHL